MFCISCGNKITSDEKFCTHCGQTIGVSENKNHRQVNLTKTTSGGVKKLLKFCLWLGLAGLGIWLIIALGPLWIIAIILLLILFVLANRQNEQR